MINDIAKLNIIIPKNTDIRTKRYKHPYYSESERMSTFKLVEDLEQTIEIPFGSRIFIKNEIFFVCDKVPEIYHTSPSFEQHKIKVPQKAKIILNGNECIVEDNEFDFMLKDGVFMIEAGTTLCNTRTILTFTENTYAKCTN